MNESKEAPVRCVQGTRDFARRNVKLLSDLMNDLNIFSSTMQYITD